MSLEAEVLLKELAACKPAQTVVYHDRCRFCGEGGQWAGSSVSYHAPSCIWVRARVLVGLPVEGVLCRCTECGLTRPFGASHSIEDCQAAVHATRVMREEQAKADLKRCINAWLRHCTDSLLGFNERGGFGYSSSPGVQDELEAALAVADEDALAAFYGDRPRQCRCGRAALWLRGGVSRCDEHWRTDGSLR